jgi:hypothetical protein
MFSILFILAHLSPNYASTYAYIKFDQGKEIGSEAKYRKVHISKNVVIADWKRLLGRPKS